MGGMGFGNLATWAWRCAPSGRIDTTRASSACPAVVPQHRLRTSGRFSAILAAAMATLAPQPAMAQQSREANLADLSLEQLLEVPLVSVASRRPQKAEDAPAVVTVVTDDEIQRHGYRTLADVLRTLPAFYVSYDRNYSYVGVRGFGRPGDYNTRILLLIDGIRINDDIYDGAYVGWEMPLDVATIERIEVSRGPGAAVYGNNAFFGVVNVVTKRAPEAKAGELRLGSSSYGTYEALARYGRRSANGAGLVASASVLTSSGQTLTFPEFARQNDGVVAGADGESSAKAFASFSKGGFFLEAFHSRRSKHVPTASYDSLFGDTREVTRDSFSGAAATYQRSLGPRLDWSNRVAWVAYDYEGTYPYELTPGHVSLLDDYGRGRWWSAETTGVLRAGRHTLVLGGELTRNSRQDQGGGYADVPESAFAIPDRGHRYGVYAQDELALGPRLRLSLGCRYDHHEDFGGKADPRFAVIVTPDRRTRIKLLYGSAYRAPNEYEQNYYSAQRRAQDELRPETIHTLEAAIERRLAGPVRLGASVFFNDIHDLLALESDPEGELLFDNAARVRSRGAELVLDARLGSGMLGQLSYSYQHTRGDDGLPLSNSPTHMLKAALSVPFRDQTAWVSLDAQYLSSRLTLSGAESGRFLLVNATLFAGRLPGRLEASASVYNLFDARYSDPASEEHLQDAIRQNGRSFAVKLGWRF